MRRRDFMTLAGAAGAALPLVARAQSAPKPVIGFLNGFSAAEWESPLTGFRKGLSEAGFAEGQNVSIEFRWAEGHRERVVAFANELVQKSVSVLVATGGSQTAVAAKAATSTIPIVFGVGTDPFKSGLVTSLSRTKSNVTGVYFLTGELDGKRLGLLREVTPAGAMTAALFNPTNLNSASVMIELQVAAQKLGQQIHIVYASNEAEIESALATASQMRAAALLVGADPFFLTRRDQIVSLAARYALPTIYHQRDFVTAGGLMSYGTSLFDATRQVGVWTGHILKGEKPANLPVVQSTRFELVVNAKTAKQLNLTIPPALIAAADEVID